MTFYFPDKHQRFNCIIKMVVKFSVDLLYAQFFVGVDLHCIIICMYRAINVISSMFIEGF